MPYKTSQNIIDGATITFLDVSDIKIIQKKLRSALNYMENIIDTVKEPLVVLSQELEVVSANRFFL